MTDLRPSDFGMTTPLEHTWIASWKFYMTAPWGPTSAELCAEIPSLYDKPNFTWHLGPLLWATVIAPAISTFVTLDWLQSIVWNRAILPNPVIPEITWRGQHIGTFTNRENSGQWVLDTGKGKRFNRRIFLPAMPSGWAHGGLLTRDGWEGLIGQARAAYMGLQPLPPDQLATWYVAYPRLFEPTLENPNGVGFLPVKDVRVCWHTDKAPELSGALWP